MERAAVLIAVSRAGTLPTLQAAHKSMETMRDWLLAQKVPPERIKRISDQKGPVDAQQIKDAVKEILDSGSVEQLLIYFAGHGVNLRYGEYWLLSDAPQNTQAAVNVEGSVVLARQCSIPHVIIISDACRTAPESTQSQFITGSEIFPNVTSFGGEKSVDLFFACTLGNPAHEIKESRVAAQEYKSIYTTVLLEALQGKYAEVVEPNGTFGLIRPRPLKKCLPQKTAEHLRQAHIHAKVVQIPDARVTSDDDAWLARIEPLPSAVTRSGLGNPSGEHPSPPMPIERESWTDVTRLFQGSRESLLKQVIENPDPQKQTQIASFIRIAQDFEPLQFESRCGFKVNGAQIINAHSERSALDVMPLRDAVRIWIGNKPENTLLDFDNGTCTVLPAIPGFIAAVDFTNGELTRVSYEPSANYEPSAESIRWSQFQEKSQELRLLRSVIAEAAQQGVFRLDREDALELSRRMQYAKGVDPSMAIYAGYAYHDIQKQDLIEEMIRFLRIDLGLIFFDLALLHRQLGQMHDTERARVFPFFPLLSQGWALLEAYNVRSSVPFSKLQRYLRPSLWTLFDQSAISLLQTTLQEVS